MRAAVSIDLDGLPCYYRIHGLGPPPPGLEHAILARALPRAAALFDRLGVPVTWFVVGRDADVEAATSPADRAAREASAALLAARARAGDELGNHSYGHPYDLARLPAATIDEELAGCDRVLRRLAGGPARGFRGPGYDLSPPMLAALVRLGYRYDSSIFPAPGYYAAKAAVMAALAVAGRPSGAVLTEPRALAAPTTPYRPSMRAPWRRGDAPLVELPIAVTPWLRLPAIGTSLLVAPAPLRRLVLAQMADRPLFNFELHGIDFADAALDGIPDALVARQVDLRLPVAEKLARLEAILGELGRTRRFVTLGDAAEDLAREV